MTTYTPAPEEVHARCVALIKRFHPDLVSVGIRLDILFAQTDAEDGHSVKLNGYPCQAVVSILGPKERAKEQGDAQIIIDEENYHDLTEEEQDALLDHELYHLEVVKDQHGRPKRDPYGRPKLKMRLHDVQFGWFEEIARRHKQASGEVKQATQLYGLHRQTYFDFVDDTRSEKHRELDERLAASLTQTAAA